MRIETHGHQIELTPALKAYVQAKLQRLGKHLGSPLEVRTQLGIRKPDYVAEATLSLPGRSLHANAGAPNLYAAIDILADKLDRLVLKHKRKQATYPRGERLAFE